MRRIGRRPLGLFATLAVLLLALPAWADTQFYQTVDRKELGVDDQLQLNVVVTNGPRDAQLQLPDFRDFDVLSKFQSTQSSFSFGSSGGPQITQTQKYTVILRPLRTGDLVVPPAKLQEPDGHTLKTDAIPVKVRSGHVNDPSVAQRQKSPDPFAQMQQQVQQMQRMMGMDDDPFDDQPPDVQVPASDSDLFVRSSLEPTSVYVGQQATLSIYIYSRVDISSVNAITMPKLDGFWSEDIESPSQLSGETRVIGGVPYRAYLIRRKALFPVKPGTLQIDAPEADIATGFFFSNRSVHRVGNTEVLKVKPLPPGAPPNFSPANVGEWRLTSDASTTQVELGQPVTVHVTLEGQGNLKNITVPRLTGPASVKIYDPTTTDKTQLSGNRVGGRRVFEYLVMPQQTGTFTLPPVELPYFDPRTGKYDVARTQPITFRVIPGSGGATSIASTPQSPDEGGVKNVLAADALHPLRYRAHFESPRAPIWTRRFFIPIAALPFGLWLAVGFVGAVKGRKQRDAGVHHKRLAKEARAHLAAAQKLKDGGSPEAFYAELERALLGFMESKLQIPVGGLTRDGLHARLAEAKIPAAQQERIRQVLDACDHGRFAPGLVTGSREDTLQMAAQIIDQWGRA